jgi:hypothetical protein
MRYGKSSSCPPEVFIQPVAVIALPDFARGNRKGDVDGDGNGGSEGKGDGDAIGDLDGDGQGEGEGKSVGDGKGDGAIKGEGNGSPKRRPVRGASGFLRERRVEGTVSGAIGRGS